MNTYSNHYRVNFDNGNFTEELNADRFMTQQAMACLEFTNEGGVKSRYIGVDLHPRLKNGIIEFQIAIQHEIKPGEWIDDVKGIMVQATRGKFVNKDTGEEMDAEGALQYVDDVDREIMDMTDPENPVSFDPKQYKKKAQMKNSCETEFDYFVKVFGSGGESLYDYMFQVLAKNAGVEIPAS